MCDQNHAQPSALEESYARDLCTRNGLDVTGLHAGSWSGQPGAPETEHLGQDLVIGVKR